MQNTLVFISLALLFSLVLATQSLSEEHFIDTGAYEMEPTLGTTSFSEAETLIAVRRVFPLHGRYCGPGYCNKKKFINFQQGDGRIGNFRVEHCNTNGPVKDCADDCCRKHDRYVYTIFTI